MKRSIILMLLLLGAVFVFAQTPEASIQEMSGTVELKIPGSADWKPAKQGDRIELSTIISTGFKSTAVLIVGNSTLIVRPLTRLSLETLMNREETETINIGLRTGRIQVNVKPPAGGKTEFSVQSPVATASVRGTVFSIDPVNLRVIEGSVRYQLASGQAMNRPVLVNAGQQSWIDVDTGRTVNPLAQADANRALPALAGQNAAAGTESGAKLKIAQGTLAIEAPLEW